MAYLRKIIIYSIIISLLFVGSPAQTALAASYSQNDLDIMFVVDYSNSMNGNDKDKMALQMIGAFIDTSFSTKVRIGYTAYNHKILSAVKPQAIDTKEKRDSLRNKVTQVQRSGSTDIGLALKYGKSLLDSNGKRKSIMILISDGETDLTYANTGRTKKDSDRDMAQTAAECSKLGIPIYTIAFSDSFDGDSKILEGVSEQTKAVSYKARKPGDLIDIFNQIIKGNMMSSIIPIGAGMSGGSTQSITIPIPDNEEVREANILVVSTTPIEEANLLYKGKESSFHRSQYYFTGKIVNPKSSEATLQLKTQPGSQIKMYLQLYRDLDFKVDILEVAGKNQPFVVEGYFYDKTAKQQVTRESFYKDFTPRVEIYPLTKAGKVDKKAEKIKVDNMGFDNGILRGSVKLQKKGKYKLNFSMKSDSNSLLVNNIPFEIKNDPPEGEFESELTYHTFTKDVEFDLSQYFTDENGDTLTYQILGTDNIGAKLNGDQLKLQIKGPGTSQLKVQVEDGDGGTLVSEGTTVTVLPIWKYYIEITLVAAALLALIVIVLALLWLRHVKNRPRPFYSGKLNIYFTRMPDDMEIEALTFMLYPLETSEVTLGTLLDGAGVTIQELDSYKVKFMPSFDKKIIFCHNTANNIMLGSSIACKGLKYSMEYGSKIYITSKGEEYELEIHYVSAKV